MTGVERHERAAFEAERAVRNDDAAELGVVDSLQAAAGMHVLVLDHLAQFAYRRAGHALFQHELGDLVLGMLRGPALRSEEHTSELQSLMRISYAVFCLKKQNNPITNDMNQ